ncbi:hypothetical protein NUKP67_25860 [Klebsiella variicola]|nr:hypothetical protein NUKP67_25860 [Klebsiella variicola]
MAKGLFFEGRLSYQWATKTVSQALSHLPGTTKRRRVNAVYPVITRCKRGK